MDLCCRASEQIHEHTSDTDQRHAGVSDDGHLLMEEKIRCEGGTERFCDRNYRTSEVVFCHLKKNIRSDVTKRNKRIKYYV